MALSWSLLRLWLSVSSIHGGTIDLEWLLPKKTRLPSISNYREASGMKRVKDIFAKICLFLFGTFGCMIFGAVIVYWIAGAIYLMDYSGEQVDPMQASEA